MKQKEIVQIANEKNVQKTTIDKDWVLGHFLNAMYSFPVVRKLFVFKGGTCLHKCYVSDYRFSEDLDFTLLNPDFSVDRAFINQIIKKAQENSSAKFYLERIENQKYKDIPQGYKVEIKFWGADHSPNQRPLPSSRWQTNIHLDISFSEKLVLEPVEREMMHPYSDIDLISNTIICYHINEIVAEKIRALKQRNRPRDIYDVWHLSKQINGEILQEIKALLLEKSAQKGLEISGTSDFVNEEKRHKNGKEWEKSLFHQLPVSKRPAFDSIYDELNLFILDLFKEH